MDAAWTPTGIAAFIVFIGVLIFVHELGHFLAAKYFNIKVLKFSLGFGPPLVGFRRGETHYQIAAIPLGGFVKMIGDNPVDEVAPEDRDRAFSTAPIYQRAIIALAGPLFNLAFPILCFFAYNLLGPTASAPIVGQVEVNTPAARAGLMSGDRVISVNGRRTWSFEHRPDGLPSMVDLISSRAGQELTLKVLREGRELELKVTPMAVSEQDMFGAPETRGLIGVSRARAGTRVGVDDPAKNAGGFRTGDRIVSVAGRSVEHIEDLQKAVQAVAGKTVSVVVARPAPLAAGDLLLAAGDVPETLEVRVPEGADGIGALGLAPSDTFLRGIVRGGPADKAGLRPGDRVIEVDGRRVTLFASLKTVVDLRLAGPGPVRVKVRRDGAERELVLQGQKLMEKHPLTGKEKAYYDYGIGMGALPREDETLNWSSAVPEPPEQVHLSIAECFTLSVRQTANIIGLTVLGIYKLFSREVSVETVGGPIMIFQVATQAAEAGIFAYLHLLAMISVNLGLINLLPVPILDGGHLLFCAIEAIKRKPLSLRAREAASIVGLVLLLALIVLAFRNDILRLDLF